MPALGPTARQIVRIIVATLALALAATTQDDLPPLPPPRPSQLDAPPPEAPDSSVGHSETSVDQKELDAPSTEKACLERLTRLGLRFETRLPVKEEACSVDNPVVVSGLPSGIEIAPASLMTCPFAETLARWMNDIVLTEADRHFQSRPRKLLIGTSYQCRPQRSEGKQSEHAFGNAVDIMGFEFASRDAIAIRTRADDSPETAFQAAIRSAACSIFSTVLGPGSDADHADHLHLDMRERKGDYRICQ